MFHPSQAQVSGLVSEAQIHERTETFDALIDIMAQICRDRTSLPESEIGKFRREMVLYTAEQARSYGVVQTVGDLRIPGDGRATIVFLD
jgi:ATP-dependent protease ClpP protease subunit